MNNTRPVWLCPYEYPVPTTQKLLLLTVGGITSVGYWNWDDCAAYQHLPDTPSVIKRRMAAWATGVKEWREIK